MGTENFEQLNTGQSPEIQPQITQEQVESLKETLIKKAHFLKNEYYDYLKSLRESGVYKNFSEEEREKFGEQERIEEKFFSLSKEEQDLLLNEIEKDNFTIH